MKAARFARRLLVEEQTKSCDGKVNNYCNETYLCVHVMRDDRASGNAPPLFGFVCQIKRRMDPSSELLHFREAELCKEAGWKISSQPTRLSFSPCGERCVEDAVGRFSTRFGADFADADGVPEGDRSVGRDSFRKLQTPLLNERMLRAPP